MESEQEKNIEQWLRAYAARRRSSMRSPITMPPAMSAKLRRELEAAFQTQTDGTRSRHSWLDSLRFRFAAAAAGVAILVTLLVFWPQPSQIKVSQVQSTPANWEEVTPNAPAITSPPTSLALQDQPEPSLALEDNKKIRIHQARKDAGAEIEAPASSFGINAPSQSDESSLATTLPAVAQPSPPQSIDRRTWTYAQDASAASVPSTQLSFTQLFQNQIPPGSAGTPGLAVPPPSARGTRPVRRERAVPVATPVTPVTAQVLNKFNFRQEGAVVSIEDADGSVYFGRIAPPSDRISQNHGVDTQGRVMPSLSKALAPARMNERFLTPSDGSSNAAPEVAFEALGTNLSLNQKVLVQGRIITEGVSNLQESQIPIAKEKTQPLNFGQSAGAMPVPRNLMRIQGQALVGSNSIPLNAVPAKP